MKKMLKKLTTSFIAMLVLPILVGGLTAQAAEPENESEVNITLHKRVFEEGQKPADTIQNTGELMPDFGGEPLADVTFTAYDITEIYHSKLKNLTGDTETTQRQVIQDIQNGLSTLDLEGLKVADVVTNTAGEALFSELPIKSGDKDAIYVFVETKTPNTPTITSIATPIVLALPIYKGIGENQTINRDIHVYPKNEKAENTKTLVNSENFSTVTVGGVNYPNVTTGDILNYQLTFNIPSNITHADTKGYVIKDTPTAGLAYVGNLKVGDLTANTDYTLTEANGGFSIALNLASDKVKALAGSKLVVTYDMKLTATVNPDDVQKNGASIAINPGAEDETTTEITPPPGVVTGGKKFIKVDSQNNNPLQGAEFIVKQANKFGVFTENAAGEYVFDKWTETESEATKVVSKANGEFWIKGLTDGSYTLKETKAPSIKYVKLPEEVDFTVTHGDYATQELQDIKNTPKGLLPSTGGTGIIAFLVLGSAMMLGAVVWARKQKRQLNV